MIINLPFFNELNSELLTDYYEVDIDFEKENIRLDINFDETSISHNRLVILKNHLESLRAIIQIAKKAILNDFDNGEEVKGYLTFHTEELDQHDLNKLLKHADQTLPVDEQLFSMLKLRRIGFYPKAEEEFTVLDFVLDEEISQYILVVKMNDNKTVNHITMES